MVVQLWMKSFCWICVLALSQSFLLLSTVFFPFQFSFPFPSIPFHWCGGYVHVHPLGVSLRCGGCVFYTFERNLFGLRQSEVMFTSFIFQLLEDIPTILLVQFTLYSPTMWFDFEQYFERYFLTGYDVIIEIEKCSNLTLREMLYRIIIKWVKSSGNGQVHWK